MIKKILIFLLLLSGFMGRSQKNSVEVFKGFIADTLTTAEINALPDIVKRKGAYFHNKDLGSLVTWDGSAWVVATGFSGDFSDLTNVPAGLADGDDDTQLSEAQVETAYNNRVAIVSQGIAETGTSTDVYRWTPQRINQAIQALTGPGGGTYTAGNGLNLNTNEFSVDTSRVIMVDISSPILGPATIAFGTNAELDALGTPPVGTTRYEWATDGDVAVSGGDMQKSEYDINNDGIVDDAEQLDGLDSSQFVQIDDLTANDGQLTILSDDTNAKGLRLRNNTTGQSSFFWMDDSDHLNIDNSNTGARDVHINRNGSGVLRVNGNLVWNSGNDGSGSSLNADLLDDQEGSYYLNWLNFTNVPSGLADGDDDTQRTNEEIEDIIGSKIVGGTNVTTSYNDTTGETTINSTASGGVTDGDKGDITVSSGTWNIDDGVIGLSNIATGAVTSSKILDGTVGVLDLATNSVSTSKISNGTILEEDLSTTFYDEGTNTSGLSLFGSVSGTYTISSQSYDWVKVGKQVNFTLEMTGVSGSSPVGVLRIDLSGTDFPPIVGDHVFAVNMISAGAYYPDLRITNTNTVTLSFSKLESGDFTPSGVSDADLSSTSIYITGSYITN